MTIDVIDLEHQLIHLGWAFTISEIDRNVDRNDTSIVLLNNLSDVHLIHLRRVSVSSNRSPIKFCVHEGVEFSSPGTRICVRHNNRSQYEDYPESAVEPYLNPTITDFGQEIDRLLSPEPGFVGTTLKMVTEEWILNPSLNYALSVTNEDGNNADISWNVFWYVTDSI